MGIKTRCLAYQPGKFRRSTINEGVITTPSPDKYNPNKPTLVEHSIAFTKSARVNEELKN